MSDRALWYRKLAGRGSARLYSVIDGNVRQLESFGVKVISEEKPAPVREPVPPRFCPEPAAVPKGSLKRCPGDGKGEPFPGADTQGGYRHPVGVGRVHNQ